MSIRYPRYECQTNRTTNEVTAKSRSRSEPGFESQEGRTVDRTGVGLSEVEPTEVGHSTKTTSVSNVSDKKLKFSRARSHASSSAFLPSVEYLSSATRVHVGRPRTTGYTVSSQSSQPGYASVEGSADLHHSSLADSQRTMFTTNMPQIPKLVQSEQLAQRGDRARAASTQFPSTSIVSPAKSFSYSPSTSPNSRSVPTDSSNTGGLAFYKQAASKHATGLRVKGQAEMEMQWNASQATYPYRVNRNDPRKNCGDTRDYQSAEQFYDESSLTEMDNANCGSRRRQRKGENVGTETSDKSTSYSQQRLANTGPAFNFKHRAPNGSKVCGVSSSYAESGSDESLPSSSYESDVSPSADVSRSSKRRKRVKRKNSNKSIGSSMYGDDNTSDGESVTETQSEMSDSCSKSMVERYSRKSHSNAATQGRERTQTQPGGISARSASSSSITMLRTRRIMSTSLTSVSSFEGAASTVARKSSVGSRSTSPGGTTVAKVSKIQIQSFSATLPRLRKGKENRSSASRSEDENGGGKSTPERSLSSDELSRTNRSRAPPIEQGQLSKSPFGLKHKPFQLQKSKFSSDHEQSRTQSPAGSDRSSAESIPPVSLGKSADIAVPTSDSSIGDVFDRGIESETPPPPGFHPTSMGGNGSAFSTLPMSSAIVPYPVPMQQFSPDTVSDLASVLTESLQPAYLSRAEVGPGCCATDEAADDTVSTELEPSVDSVASTTALTASRHRPLSIVSEQDEYVESTTTDKRKDSSHSVRKHDKFYSRVSSPPPATRTSVEQPDTTEAESDWSKLRRPSYVIAQRNSEERLVSDLLRHIDQGHDLTNRKMSPVSNNSSWDNSSNFGVTAQADDQAEEFTGRDVRLSAYGNSAGRNTAPLASQEDLISFDNSEKPNQEEMKPKTLARPQIPTILSFDENDELTSFEETKGVEHKEMQVRESTHEGQESGDDVFMEKGKEGESKDKSSRKATRTPLSEADVDSECGPPYKTVGLAPTPVMQHQRRRSLPILIKSEPSNDDHSSLRNTKRPSFETDQYMNERNLQKQTISDDYDEESSLRKSSTFDNLSLSEHEGVTYDDHDDTIESTYFENKDTDVVSCGSPTDIVLADSTSTSQLSLDTYSVTSSGFCEQGQISMPELPQVGDHLMTQETGGIGKASEAWRSHSDPSGQANGSTQLITEAVADAELKVYRNSNSEPNLTSEKLKEEAAKLARRVNSGSQSDGRHLYPKEIQPDGQSKDDSAVEISPDEYYEAEAYPKAIRKIKSAPTTPTQTRKQKFPNTFNAEKTQLKLAKLAAMEPILETPQVIAVEPLSKQAKDRKRALQTDIKPVSPLEEKRPPATGHQEAKPSKSKHHDVRRHVLQNLLETEKSYVQNLHYLVSNYYKELKKPENSAIVDPAQVEEMFYQIPDILLCHEFFLEQLQARVNDWHDRQKIGDIFVASFTKYFLMDAYSAFINHFLQARAAVRSATLSRPLFARFIEQSLREHREKLTLQDLMIMPVQRIPRYVLILKDMIKHTPHDHPDHGNLQLALGEIKQLADRMNKGEMEADQAEREAERLREIEATIENMTDLVLPSRRLIRQDLVAEVRGSITKKDRCLFLFNDLLICATVKRRANALRRGSLSLFSGQSGTEFNKYKLLWRLPLECVELTKSSPDSGRRNSIDKQLEKLDNDMAILSQVSSLADTLAIQHQALDTAIRDLMNDVSRQIQDKNIPVPPLTSTKLELQAQTEEGPDTFIFLFLETEIKNSWEAYFDDAKQKLAYAKDTFPPEFLSAIPITKTRSGMQFTCAAPSHVPHMLDRGNHCGTGDVWVCNSDGYVGQVWILSMAGEIQPMASLSVCSSRILCVSPVPGSKLIGLECSQSDTNNKPVARTPSIASDNSYGISTQVMTGSGYISDEDMTSAQTIMAFDSSSDDEEGLGADSFVNEKFNGSESPMFDGRLSPEGSSLGTAGSLDGDAVSSQDEEEEVEEEEEDDNVSDFHVNDSSDDEEKSIGKGGRKQHMKRKMSTSLGSAMSRSSDGFTLKGSLTDLLGFDANEGSTLWLGTEDGSIYVYPVNESPVQARKNKMKIQHHTAVLCVLYVENQVFVSLANGDLCCYRRQPGSPWEVASPVKVNLGQSGAPVSCMTAIHGRLWCGCHCNVVVVDTSSLQVQTTFNSSLDRDRAVYRMASSGMGVWLSLQSSAVVRLFHATSFENLADVDVGPPVLKMLQGSDAIIRQHKAACLRITSLLTCKDLLWIGTSAGVVLTLPLPTISANTASLRNCPTATASFHGHTGHVRFLTAVDVSKESNKEGSLEKDKNGKKKLSTVGPKTGAGHDIVIISGGDGYEDFKTSASSETAGRDDSTNHLLTWRV